MSHNPIFNRALATGVEDARIQAAQAEIDAQFDSIVAGRKMTIEGTSMKVLGLFGVLLAAAAVTTIFQLQVLLFPAMLVGLVLGLWATFSRKVRPGVIMAYAASQGVFLVGITMIFEQMYPGIATQAVTATLAVAGSMFAAYAFGWIKVTPGFTKVMMFAIIGYAVFGIGNLIFAMATGASAYSSAFGWLIALVGAGLAAFTLNLDFETIKQGTAQGLPVENEWRAAFGLTSSLIWLYVEILRLLSIFNRD